MLVNKIIERWKKIHRNSKCENNESKWNKNSSKNKRKTHLKTLYP